MYCQLEKERSESIADMTEKMAMIAQAYRLDDRVRFIWNLKLVAQNIAKLDQIDRLESYLPIGKTSPHVLSSGSRTPSPYAT